MKQYLYELQTQKLKLQLAVLPSKSSARTNDEERIRNYEKHAARDACEKKEIRARA